MGATLSSDFAFVPKVWQDHISAYFDRKMGIGALAVVDNTLTAAPGETVNFPYFKSIGAAEEPGESEGLNVDNLEDDSFAVTIKEVAKAVGVKARALRKSAASKDRIFTEAQSQIGRVFAEKVDSDLITLINTSGNYTEGFLATAAAHVCNITNVLDAKITAFGDKQDQSVAIAMHSLHFKSLMTDTTAGFLKADATDPMWGVPGFQGRLLGMAVLILDSMPAHANVDSKKAYEAFIFKASPFGIYIAEEPVVESDYDLLHREYVFAGTQYYGVCALHAKVSANDKRICRATFTTTVAA